ncbi:hypothetical protein MRX96_027786 [Rhipicephalus microplus]
MRRILVAATASLCPRYTISLLDLVKIVQWRGCTQKPVPANQRSGIPSATELGSFHTRARPGTLVLSLRSALHRISCRRPVAEIGPAGALYPPTRVVKLDCLASEARERGKDPIEGNTLLQHRVGGASVTRDSILRPGTAYRLARARTRDLVESQSGLNGQLPRCLLFAAGGAHGRDALRKASGFNERGIPFAFALRQQKQRAAFVFLQTDGVAFRKDDCHVASVFRDTAFSVASRIAEEDAASPGAPQQTASREYSWKQSVRGEAFQRSAPGVINLARDRAVPGMPPLFRFPSRKEQLGRCSARWACALSTVATVGSGEARLAGTRKRRRV